jgi:hypothetical protein
MIVLQNVELPNAELQNAEKTKHRITKRRPNPVSQLFLCVCLSTSIP